MKRSISNFLEYLFSFLIIIDCNTIYRQYISGSIMYTICAILLILLIVMTHKKLKIDIIFKTVLFVIIIPLFYIFQYDDIQHNDYRLKLYFVYFFCIFPLVYIYYNLAKDKYSVLYKFSSLISILSLYSTFLWLFCSFLQVVPMPHMILNNWAENEFVPSFYYVYFETQAHSFFGMEIVRNSAIFSEGPMFAICLYTALLIELLLKENINKWHVSFLLAGILTSTSTTAYIVTMIIFTLRFVSKQKNMIRLIIVYLPVIAIVLLFVFGILLQEKESSNAVSYYTRLSGYTKGWEVFMDNPMFGKGFYSQTESNSNSIIVILSEIGIVGSLPFLFGLLFVPISLLLNYTTRNRAFAGLVFFLGYSFTIVTYCLISVVFSSFFISQLNFYNCRSIKTLRA